MRQEKDPQQDLPSTPDSPGRLTWKERARQRIGDVKERLVPKIGTVTIINLNEKPPEDKTPAKEVKKTTRTRTTTTRKPALTREEFETYMQAHNEQERSSNSRAGLVGAGAGILALALATGAIGMELGKRIDDKESAQRIEVHVIYPSFIAETPKADPRPSTQPTVRPTEAPIATPIAERTAIPTEIPSQNPDNELPLPITGKPSYAYVLDGWFLIDGDIMVKNNIDSDYVRTYDDFSHTAQQTIAGPGVEVTSLYGFSAYPLAGETSDFDMNDASIRESIDTRIRAKLDEGYEIVDVDFMAPGGELINIGTYTE